MKTNINLGSVGTISLIVSASIIVVGIAIVYGIFGGLALGIDFKSGISMQVAFTDTPSREELFAALEDIGSINLQSISNSDNRYLIKSDTDEQNDGDVVAARVQERLESEFGADNVEVLELLFTGPRYSQAIARRSITLTVSALLFILIYIWFRFRLRYSVSAIAALVHDVLMMIVFLGITRTELSTTTVAAILTIIGYSLNDTVVIFDRIRENTSNTRKVGGDFSEITRQSIRQSLSRTIITSLTTLLAVIAIYIFSSGLVKDFALCMSFGVIVGTYSSIFIASPVLILWTKRSAKRENRPSGREAIAAPHEGGAQQEKPRISERKSPAEGQERAIDTERIKQQLRAQRARQQKKKKKR